eukprot:GCRY01007332.1.p1 GENE.GCRY01007332.1~~GCRY01007332.1.p1  ORF type:complete len:198 (-),score=24.24 GCRY01007332.1:296-889(-)
MGVCCAYIYNSTHELISTLDFLKKQLQLLTGRPLKQKWSMSMDCFFKKSEKGPEGYLSTFRFSDIEEKVFVLWGQEFAESGPEFYDFVNLIPQYSKGQTAMVEGFEARLGDVVIRFGTLFVMNQPRKILVELEYLLHGNPAWTGEIFKEIAEALKHPSVASSIELNYLKQLHTRTVSYGPRQRSHVYHTIVNQFLRT